MNNLYNPKNDLLEIIGDVLSTHSGISSIIDITKESSTLTVDFEGKLYVISTETIQEKEDESTHDFNCPASVGPFECRCAEIGLETSIMNHYEFNEQEWDSMCGSARCKLRDLYLKSHPYRIPKHIEESK